jgi:hypothetical protein
MYTLSSTKCDVIVLFINLGESGMKFVSHFYLNEKKISRWFGMKPCALFSLLNKDVCVRPHFRLFLYICMGIYSEYLYSGSGPSFEYRRPGVSSTRESKLSFGCFIMSGRSSYVLPYIKPIDSVSWHILQACDFNN